MIKLIAVDMDGTFLNHHLEYDRQRFRELYKIMKENDIKFVVASGNQYYQLKSFFEDYQDELIYVAENGALVIDQQEVLFSADIPKKEVHQILNILERYPEIEMILCGLNSAYISSKVPDEFFKLMQLYLHRLDKVDDFYSVDDQFLKFALTCPPEKTYPLTDALKKEMNGKITPVTSGHGYIDLIVPSYHKASGIQRICDRYGILPEECMAFGDGDNDIEMLKHCFYSYAMKNGSDGVKAAARYETLSNEESGVIKTIEKHFKEMKLI